MTQKQLEKISIVPPEKVTLCGPYEKDRETFIAIHNPIKKLIAFKIATSAGITVRPRFGYIRSKGETFIKVKAEAGEPEDVTSTKPYCIKITFARARKDHPAKPNEFWKEGSAPETVLMKKLQIVFQVEVEKLSSDSSASSSLSDASENSKKEMEEMEQDADPEPVDQKKDKAEAKISTSKISAEGKSSTTNVSPTSRGKDNQENVVDKKFSASFSPTLKEKDIQKVEDKKSSTSISPTSKDKQHKLEENKSSISVNPTAKDIVQIVSGKEDKGSNKATDAK